MGIGPGFGVSVEVDMGFVIHSRSFWLDSARAIASCEMIWIVVSRMPSKAKIHAQKIDRIVPFKDGLLKRNISCASVLTKDPRSI